MKHKRAPNLWILDAYILLIIFLCAQYFLSRIILRYPLYLDEGISLYDAVRIFKGQVPYRDFFHITTPGAAWLLAHVFRVSGISILSARLVMAVFGLGLMVLLFSMGKSLFKTIILPVFPPLLLFFIDILPNPEFSTHIPAVFSTLLSLASLIFINGYMGMFVAGIFGGVSFLMNQYIGGFSLLGLGILALMKPVLLGQRSLSWSSVKYLILLAAGVFLVLGPILMILGFYGALGDYFYDTLWGPITWYRSFNRYPYFSYEITAAGRFLREIRARHLILMRTADIGAILFIGFLPLVVYPAVLAISFLRREWPLFSLSVMGLLLFLSSSNHPDLLHVVRSLPTFYPLITLLLIALWREIKKGRSLAWFSFVPVLLLTALVFLDGLYSLWAPRASPQFPVTTERGTLYYPTETGANTMNEVINYVVSATKPLDSVFFYHWSPELYFLCNRDNPTSFDTYKPLYTTPAQLEELKVQLKRSRPGLIVKDNYIASFSDPYSSMHTTFPFVDPQRLTTEDPVDRWILYNYKEIKTIGTYHILVPSRK